MQYEGCLLHFVWHSTSWLLVITDRVLEMARHLATRLPPHYPAAASSVLRYISGVGRVISVDHEVGFTRLFRAV
jgi:hypothetical protein